MHEAPVSKPPSIDEQVSKVYGELKDGVKNHSIENVMNELDADMLNMSAKDWSKFSAALHDKINATDQMLPQLTILATGEEFAGDLASGHIDQTDIGHWLTDDQRFSKKSHDTIGKTSFNHDLIQSFLDKDFNYVKDETCHWHDGRSVSKEDLQKAFDEHSGQAQRNESCGDALTLLEKNKGKDFTALADEYMDVTKESVQSALDKNTNAVAKGSEQTLTQEQIDLATQLVDDKNDLFNSLGKNNAITFDSMAAVAAKANWDLDQLRATKDDKSGDGTTASKDKSGAVDQSKSTKSGGGEDSSDKKSNSQGTKNGAPGDGSTDTESKNTKDTKTDSSHKKTAEHAETYTVRHGDDLTHIARRRLIEEHIKPTQGKVNEMVAEIAAHNGIANPDFIRDGQVLHF